MFRKIVLAAAVAVSLVCSVGRDAEAAYLVNTGTPSGNTNDWTLWTSQYFAGRFSVANSTTITSVESFLQDFLAPQQMTVAIHSPTGNVPGAVLYSQTFTTSGGPINSSSPSWQGVFGLDWDLAPGVYWASFIPSGGVFGIQPGPAPSPLDEYALGGNGVWNDSQPADFYDSLRIALRIGVESSPVPLPGMLSLLGLGCIGLAAAARRRQA